MDISKCDWKLYMEKVPEWQERHMERLIDEYIEMLSSDEPASEKFWVLEKQVKSDKRHPGVLIEMRKSKAIYDIARFIMLSVITFKDLAPFSDELKQNVNEITRQRG